MHWRLYVGGDNGLGRARHGKAEQELNSLLLLESMAFNCSAVQLFNWVSNSQESRLEKLRPKPGTDAAICTLH